MPKYTPRSLTAYFDNGGGITIQCPRYVHHYDDAEQAARDFAQLAKGTDMRQWEGHEPEMRINDNHPECAMYNRNRILSRMYKDNIPTSGYAEDEFYKHLKEYIEEQ